MDRMSNNLVPVQISFKTRRTKWDYIYNVTCFYQFPFFSNENVYIFTSFDDLTLPVLEKRKANLTTVTHKSLPLTWIVTKIILRSWIPSFQGLRPRFLYLRYGFMKKYLSSQRISCLLLRVPIEAPKTSSSSILDVHVGLLPMWHSFWMLQSLLRLLKLSWLHSERPILLRDLELPPPQAVWAANVFMVGSVRKKTMSLRLVLPSATKSLCNKIFLSCKISIWLMIYYK